MNRRHIRAGRAVVVAVALAAAIPAALPTSASADPISDQKALVSEVTDRLEALETQSDILAENLVTALDEKTQLDAQVTTAEQKVAEQQGAVDALRGQLSQVAVQAYMGAGTGSSSPMFNSSADVTDILARDQLSRVAMSAGAATTDQYEEAVKQLEAEQQALDDARSAAAAKAEQIKSDKAATDKQTAEYTKARAEAEAKLGTLIQEEEERRARESYEKLQRAAEAAAAAQRAAAEQAAAEQQQRQQQQEARAAAANTAAPAPSAAPAAPAAPAAAPAAASPKPAKVQAIAASVPEASTQPVPAASSRAGTAVNAAMSQLGVPYVGYQASPGVGFDCSGLTSWAWGQAGVGLPHQSRAQFGSLPHVPIEAAQPGDLLFFYSPISHVSMYIGGGQQIHAPATGDVVKIVPVNWGKVVGVGRPG
jgi:cell wall-associated NlpC family hydrolase